jgi:hypothetical protein
MKTRRLHHSFQASMKTSGYNPKVPGPAPPVLSTQPHYLDGVAVAVPEHEEVVAQAFHSIDGLSGGHGKQLNNLVGSTVVVGWRLVVVSHGDEPSIASMASVGVMRSSSTT